MKVRIQRIGLVLKKSGCVNMNYKNCLKLLLSLAVIAASTTAPLKSNLVKFYPISRAQYDEILRMTAGRPIISEGRLISGGFRALNELRTAISSDISTGWTRILNITGLIPRNTRSGEAKVNGYPLCVIKTNEWNGGDDEYEENAEVDSQLGQRRGYDYVDDEDKDDISSIEDTRANDDDDAETDERPIVSCIVVVKPKDEDEQYDQLEKNKAQLQSSSMPLTNKLRSPAYSPPFYHPAYPGSFGLFPGYNYFGYPYFPQSRSHKSSNIRAVSAFGNKARQSHAKKDMLARSATPTAEKKPELKKDASKGRSGYQGYYPQTYGYYQQPYAYSGGSPYGGSVYSGGCQQGSYYPYGEYPYGDGYHPHENSEESDEDRDFSGEIYGKMENL